VIVAVMAAIAGALAGSRCGGTGVAAAAASPQATVMVGSQPGDSERADPPERRLAEDLQRAVEAAREGGTVRLEAARYRFQPVPYADSTCANCERPDSLIQATRALLITGRGVRLVGAGPGRTILETRAGYGVLFENCTDCAIESLTVTGGANDTGSMASGAAVVVVRAAV
jgi:hypothetical protein